jgi:hypothetical protein
MPSFARHLPDHHRFSVYGRGQFKADSWNNTNAATNEAAAGNQIGHAREPLPESVGDPSPRRRKNTYMVAIAKNTPPATQNA